MLKRECDRCDAFVDVTRSDDPRVLPEGWQYRGVDSHQLCRRCAEAFDTAMDRAERNFMLDNPDAPKAIPLPPADPSVSVPRGY